MNSVKTRTCANGSREGDSGRRHADKTTSQDTKPAHCDDDEFSFTSDFTAETEPTTISSSSEPRHRQHQHLQRSGERCAQLLNRIAGLLVVSISSFGIFLLVFLPSGAFVTLFFFSISSSLATYRLYLNLSDRIQNHIRSRGIGDMLPSQIYEVLTKTTLHDVLRKSKPAIVAREGYGTKCNSEKPSTNQTPLSQQDCTARA